jgi:hypothetical protein
VIILYRCHLFFAVAAALVGHVPSNALAQQSQPSGATRPVQALKTVAVVAVAPYDNLIRDINLVGTWVGRPEIGQIIELQFEQFTGGKGAAAIDRTKPWGLIVQTDGTGFLPVACLPVREPDAVLQGAAQRGMTVKDAPGGLKELRQENGRAYFVKTEGNWTYVSNTSTALDRLPADPQATLAEAAGDKLISVNALLSNVPEFYRQFALQMVQSGMQQQLQKKPGETDEQFNLRRPLAEAELQQTVRRISDLDSLRFDFAVDSSAKQTRLDFGYLFKEGTPLARQHSAYGESKTSFAGFYQPDAAATVIASTQADPSQIGGEIAQTQSKLKVLQQFVDKEIDTSDNIKEPAARQELKAAFSDVLEAALATIRSGKIDAAATLQLGPNNLAAVVGTHVVDTAKIESALKHVDAAAQASPKVPPMKWNAANHSGVTFHAATIPVTGDDARRHLGESVTIAVGIGEQAVYVAVGEASMANLTRAIDDSSRNTGRTAPAFDMIASVGKIAEAVAATPDNERQGARAKAIVDEIRAHAPDRDKVRMVGNYVSNGLKFSLSVDEGALKAIGAAAAARQNASAGQ